MLEIIAVGGGGGGYVSTEVIAPVPYTGSALISGAGGGAGGAVTVYYRNPAIAPWAVVVGAGGSGATYPFFPSTSFINSGTPGGDTTVIPPFGGPTIYAYGGQHATLFFPGGGTYIRRGGLGGTALAPSSSGAWGTFMGSIYRYGDHGQGASTFYQYPADGFYDNPCNGGSSLLGHGGWGGGSSGQENGSHGGGGAGGYVGTSISVTNGGNGGAGIVIFKAYG
jgi:hypothetical protein